MKLKHEFSTKQKPRYNSTNEKENYGRPLIEYITWDEERDENGWISFICQPQNFPGGA